MSGSRPSWFGPGVVPAVLGLPPAVAQPGEDPGDDPGRPLVPPRRREDLPVGGVVPEEPELRADEGERRGEQDDEPRVPQQDDPRAHGGEGEDRDGEGRPVEAVPAAQQPRAAHRPGQVGVGAHVGSAGRGPGTDWVVGIPLLGSGSRSRHRGPG